MKLLTKFRKWGFSLSAFSRIQSNNRVFIQGGAATPSALIRKLIAESERLENVEIIHLHTMAEPLYAKVEFKKSFRTVNLFVGENLRKCLDYDRIDYLPCFLSEIPSLFRQGIRRPDVALIQVSPPDRHGFCSLGTSVDVTKAAIETASLIIAQVNSHMPRVHGDGIIHQSQIDELIFEDTPLPQSQQKILTEEEKQIGKNVASVIEDGSTLQVGIGSIPDAALAQLHHLKNLGIHTEMWSDGVLNLIKKGVIDNSQKKILPGKTVGGFIIGSQSVYDFINDNPSVHLLDISYVNSPSIIAQNPRAVAINSALEIDLTGQVCADSIGTKIISGVGGQMDFMRGSILSPGGKAIIALTSRTKKGMPRIVPVLKTGAGVVTTRSHIHFVATEYGIVDLYGKTLHERAKSLISIAHPEDRDQLIYNWNHLRD